MKPPRTVAEVLAAANLPEPLAARVRETVRRTRLRRRERVEIARELAAHMQAGLDAGTSVAEQAEAFGDPRTVARPLRQAARRRRSPLDRAAVVAAKLAGVAVLLYGIAAVRIATLRPTPDFDGIERLRAMTPAVPQSGDAAGVAAWPAYREALAWSRRERDGGFPITGSVVLGDVADADAAALAADREALRGRAAELEAIRRAAAMPVFGWPVDVTLDAADRAYFDETDPTGSLPATSLVIGVQLPYFNELRHAARLLAAEIRLATDDAAPDATTAPGDRITENLLAMLGIARHSGEVPVLIGQLVEVAIIALAGNEAVRVLETNPSLLTDANLDRIAAGFAAIAPETWVPRIEGERLMLEDMVQHVYSTDADGDGVLLPAAFQSIATPLQAGGDAPSPLTARPSLMAMLGGPISAAVIAGPKETLDEADRLYALLLAEAERPLLEQAGAYDAEVEQLNRVRLPLLSLLMPAIGRVGEQLAIVRMNAERIPVAVAIERHRRQHGRPPADLEALLGQPGELERIPADAWDGQRLRYGATDGRVRLWSVGPDGRDDGGRLATDPRTGEPERFPTRRFAGLADDAPADVILLDLPAPESAAETP